MEVSMSSLSLPSMRLIIFSTFSPMAIQSIIEKLESLDQQVQLLVTSPGTNSHPISHYPQIVGGVRRGLDVLLASHMHRLPGMLKGLSPDAILVIGFPR